VSSANKRLKRQSEVAEKGKQAKELSAKVQRLEGQLARAHVAEQEAIRERGTQNVSNYSRRLDGHRSGIYYHPATDTPADCLPPGVHPDPAFYTPCLWPPSMPDLPGQAREAARFLVGVGRLIAAALDRCCGAALAGYRPGVLEALIREPELCNHKCRLICYPEYDTEEQRALAKGMWAPPHKDTGLLTALVPGVFLDAGPGAEGGRLPSCPDPEVGLYVRDHRGKILQVVVPPELGECLLFQAGEALQVVSGGLYHATEHCVRGPPRALAGYARASLAVFLQPHAHEDLPLPDGVTMQDVARRAHDGLFRMFLHRQPW